MVRLSAWHAREDMAEDQQPVPIVALFNYTFDDTDDSFRKEPRAVINNLNYVLARRRPIDGVIFVPAPTHFVGFGI